MQFIKLLGPMPGTSLLDVAGGTGDIAFRFIDAVRSSPLYSPSPANKTQVTVCDINGSMLQVGKQRALERGYLDSAEPEISFVVGDAEKLPFPDNCVDAYTIAFGIRNCTNVPQVLREAHRVLKKGGRFLCLEFSHIQSFGFANPFFQSIYDAYSFNIIPQMGQMIAQDRDSYQYLVESIRRFPDQEKFATMIKQAGFELVTYHNLTFGVASVHSGFKL